MSNHNEDQKAIQQYLLEERIEVLAFFLEHDDEQGDFERLLEVVEKYVGVEWTPESLLYHLKIRYETLLEKVYNVQRVKCYTMQSERFAFESWRKNKPEMPERTLDQWKEEILEKILRLRLFKTSVVEK